MERRQGEGSWKAASKSKMFQQEKSKYSVDNYLIREAGKLKLETTEKKNKDGEAKAGASRKEELFEGPEQVCSAGR